MKNQRILDWDRASAISKKARGADKTVVFTNGCFDILHPGHIHLLKQAKQLGDVLMVGINTDASVSRLKGPLRPIRKLEDRMTLLAAVRYVDHVIPFEQDTPLELIKTIRPHIVVKGGDYTRDQVVGHEIARVVIVPLLEGYSTTDLIARLKAINE